MLKHILGARKTSREAYSVKETSRAERPSIYVKSAAQAAVLKQKRQTSSVEADTTGATIDVLFLRAITLVDFVKIMFSSVLLLHYAWLALEVMFRSWLNQEVALRQFLETKVKDLEVELETAREYCDKNMQQAVLFERERFTQIQWDMELVWKQCLEMELKLKNDQVEKAHVES
ncbi:hypothetical protein PVK06_035693 [Gossypium arboreum]|uniref:Uncharacterized protein n=1 Tax=Gossypium arboreum TaxID=29729 RepID=A0ABR0NHH3_GOSAR|nr:hypothetical protein PVK06_035693 [Gossypium arboreum]